MTSAQRQQKIDGLREELKQVRSPLPMHGVNPETEFRMMEIEDEIAELKMAEER